MSARSQSVKKLSYLARRNLAAVLDRSSPRGADWKGLCDRMGFLYDTVRLLRVKVSPTIALLEEWERAKGSLRDLQVYLEGLVYNLIKIIVKI